MISNWFAPIGVLVAAVMVLIRSLDPGGVRGILHYGKSILCQRFSTLCRHAVPMALDLSHLHPLRLCLCRHALRAELVRRNYALRDGCALDQPAVQDHRVPDVCRGHYWSEQA